MKEKVQEFDISINFSLQANMTIEATSEREALRIAQKHYMDVIRDRLRDKENLNIKIKSVHTITPEEREKLEAENIIEPRKLTPKQQERARKKAEEEAKRKKFFERADKDVKKREKTKK